MNGPYAMQRNTLRAVSVCTECVSAETALSDGNESNGNAGKENRKLILVAEDDDSSYALMYNIFKHDYTTARAVDGVEAVRLYEELSPCLILMDIKMPKMNGLDAAAAIRRSDRSVPIVALTAYAFAEEKQAALEAGCDAVLTKPVDIRLLKRMVAEFVRR